MRKIRPILNRKKKPTNVTKLQHMLRVKIRIRCGVMGTEKMEPWAAQVWESRERPLWTL